MKYFIKVILAVVFAGCASPTKNDEQKFIKEYTLLKLDGRLCGNCILKVNEGYNYDILQNGKKIGSGNWKLEHPIDFPGYILKLENGPLFMVYESDTIIDYIDRRK